MSGIYGGIHRLARAAVEVREDGGDPLRESREPLLRLPPTPFLRTDEPRVGCHGIVEAVLTLLAGARELGLQRGRKTRAQRRELFLECRLGPLAARGDDEKADAE